MSRFGVPDRNRSGAALGVVGTVAVHAGIFLAFALVAHGQAEQKPTPPIYAVDLVAAPAPSAKKQRLAPEAVPTAAPEPEPAPPEPEPKPEPPKPEERTVPVEKPKPQEKPPAPKPQPKPAQKPAPQPENREKAPKTQSDVEPLPGETPSTGRDVANVRTPGLQFAYPEYLRNLTNEILRRFGGNHPRLRAEVSFMIMRDGSVREINFVKRSGNFSFDLDAQGAIEATANAGAFGPLPSGYENDVLPIVFVFEPR